MPFYKFCDFPNRIIQRSHPLSVVCVEVSSTSVFLWAQLSNTACHLSMMAYLQTYCIACGPTIHAHIHNYRKFSFHFISPACSQTVGESLCSTGKQWKKGSVKILREKKRKRVVKCKQVKECNMPNMCMNTGTKWHKKHKKGLNQQLFRGRFHQIYNMQPVICKIT